MWGDWTGNLVVGIASGTIASIVFAVVLFLWHRYARTQRTTINIDHCPLFSHVDIRLELLHASNDNGTIINRRCRAQRREDGAWEAIVVHPRRVGFQYKWFVNVGGGMDLSAVVTGLHNCGFTQANEGAGRARRIWFLDQRRPQAKAFGEELILNNKWYPE